MPLIKSGSKAAVGTNIREMEAAGHPRAQSIAAALHNQDRYRRARGGGLTPPIEEPEKPARPNYGAQVGEIANADLAKNRGSPSDQLSELMNEVYGGHPQHAADGTSIRGGGNFAFGGMPMGGLKTHFGPSPMHGIGHAGGSFGKSMHIGPHMKTSGAGAPRSHMGGGSGGSMAGTLSWDMSGLPDAPGGIAAAPPPMGTPGEMPQGLAEGGVANGDGWGSFLKLLQGSPLPDDDSSSSPQQPLSPPPSAPPPQGTALVGTQSPPSTFGATPGETDAIRSLISHIGGSGKQGGLLRENDGAAPSIVPYEAAKTLMSPAGQYQVGNNDTEGAQLGMDAASAAVGGSSLGTRPPSSLGILLGRRQAENLAAQGRPAARDALDMANIMERIGYSHAAIRDEAHGIFKAAGEKNFGTVYKPDYPGAEWQFEIADRPAKLAKFDKDAPIGLLGEQYQHPDLYAAEPGIENAVELRRYGRGPNTPVARHDPGNLQTGLHSEIGLDMSRTKEAQLENAAAELQHEIQWRNDWPRGGSPAEFEPGGRLANKLPEGLTPSQAYQLLEGEQQSKIAKERSLYSTTDLRNESVEETLDRLRLQSGQPIVEYYNGLKIPSREVGDEEAWRNLADQDYAQQQRSTAPGGRPVPSSAWDVLMRQDQLGRNADQLTQQAGALVNQMQAAGHSPQDIAAELSRRYGTQVDPADVASGQGWWNVKQQPITAPPTAPRPPSLAQMWPREANLQLAQMHAQDTPTAEMASKLSQTFGNSYTPRLVGDQLDRLRIGSRGQPPGAGAQDAWQPDALQLLTQHHPDTSGMTLQELADKIYGETGQVTSRSGVAGRLYRLRTKQMLSDLAKDLKGLAKAKGSTPDETPQGFAKGGVVKGPIIGPTPGRADKVNADVLAGSYIWPADVVSGRGQGNTEAGQKFLAQLESNAIRDFKNSGQAQQFAASGGRIKKDPVPVAIAHGERCTPPGVVLAIGRGDMAMGHQVCEYLTKRFRAEDIETLKKLPGPAK